METRRQNNSELQQWFRTRGFPVLVLAALVISGYLAASARVPTPVPDFALQAASVYRLEVGAACFVLFYMASWAFAFAFDVADRFLPREQERPSALEEKHLH